MSEKESFGQSGEIQPDSNVDALTGLPTRRLLMEELRCDAAANPGNFGLGFLDIDGLKRTNDTEGHPTGDILIKKTADILVEGTRTQKPAEENHKRATDMVGRSVFRWGGDEFVIKVADVSTQEGVDTVITRLQSDLAKQDISASICGRPHRQGESGEKLLEDVDRMMYIQKRARKQEEERLQYIREQQQYRGELEEVPILKFWAHIASRVLEKVSGVRKPR